MMRELKLLESRLSQGASWIELGKELGRTPSSVKERARKLGLYGLRTEAYSSSGIRCKRCEQPVDWTEMPSDDPVALVMAIAKWSGEHTKCPAKRLERRT